MTNSEETTGDTRRCKHCGMPQDRKTFDGGCPYCADLFPHLAPYPDNAARCDGCGHSRAMSSCETFRGDDTVLGTYCAGCRQILDKREISPGEHEQYTLMETNE